jgi:hypothetical protein
MVKEVLTLQKVLELKSLQVGRIMAFHYVCSQEWCTLQDC